MARDPLAAARARYARLHWGATAPGGLSEWLAPDPRSGPLVELGALLAVEYDSDKRGDGPSIYRHEFGSGGRGLPVLAVTTDHRLVIVGGNYRVRAAGIVG